MDEELKDYYVPQIFRKVFCEHSKEQPRESANLTTNFIWNLEASYLMTTTLPVFFQDLSRTASCAC